MQPQQSPSISTLVIYITLGLSSSLIWIDSQFTAVLAQSPPSVRIDNLTRMAPINRVLKQQYEAQYPDQSIQVTTHPASSTLQSLQNQQSDLAAVSRLLTSEEQAQGLIQIPVTREKIAIVVGEDNAFAQGLTIDQVVKIFRGDITDWSQIGGAPGLIKVIHRPIANNLQGTLQTYDLVGQSFNTSNNTVQLDKDSVTTLKAELGADGISYALASQIQNAQGIRPISMYQTLPDDPKYPFSQPFTYVYQGKPSASTQNFLDYVASEPGQQAIAQAKTMVSSDLPRSEFSNVSASDPELSPSPLPRNNSPGNATGSPPSSPASADQDPEDDQGSADGLWLPIGLSLLVLGGIAGGIVKTILAKKRQPQAPPRPAPNYAERIKPTVLQNTSTQLQDSSADINPIVPNPEEGPLGTENLALGATASPPSIAGDRANPPPAASESATQSSTGEGTTPPELHPRTILQSPQTHLQITPVPGQESPTQVPNETGADPPSFDDDDIETPDPKATRLQEPQSLWDQDEEDLEVQESSPSPFPDSNPPNLQDPKATRLQDPKATRLQDPKATRLQDPKATRLQEPQSLWDQDEEDPEIIEWNTTPSSDSNPPNLQDPKATRLQDSNSEKVYDPKQTWIQEDED